MDKRVYMESKSDDKLLIRWYGCGGQGFWDVVFVPDVEVVSNSVNTKDSASN